MEPTCNHMWVDLNHKKGAHHASCFFRKVVKWVFKFKSFSLGCVCEIALPRKHSFLKHAQTCPFSSLSCKWLNKFCLSIQEGNYWKVLMRTLLITRCFGRNGCLNKLNMILESTDRKFESQEEWVSAKEYLSPKVQNPRPYLSWWVAGRNK